MKTNLKLALAVCTTIFSFTTLKSSAQNLLDMQYWTVGTGTTGAFVANGQVFENTRLWGVGPQGQRAILWEGKPEGANNDDGGFNYNYFAIDPTKMYRFSIWLKKTNSNNGTSYLGTNNVNNLDGTVNDNPYFWHGDLPELNKWYLVVGYVHGSDDASTVSYGAIYDGVSGAKVIDITDFKFPTGGSSANIRSYLYYDLDVNDRQYFYAPRVEVVNGNEPSIASLLGLQTVGATQAYFTGNVGIKTYTPGAYELAVNGKIRAKEIKVETANWPDYVFEEGYKVGTLQELEGYIKANKRLPEMPSAKEVEANGLLVSEMLKLQQKKIEELTLHLIEKDKELQKEKDENKLQNERISKLEELLKTKKHN